MKERPILFSAPMVRAILDGRKTQTRRIVNWKQLHKQAGLTFPTKCKIAWFTLLNGWAIDAGDDVIRAVSCPYGQPGDRMWVRERARIIEISDGGSIAGNINDTGWCSDVKVRYEADGAISDWISYPSRLSYIEIGNCIANGCYREAARITLEVTNVRVERIQSTTLGDICKEGIAVTPYDFKPVQLGLEIWQEIWQSIYPGSWDRNDWVWVIEFRRIEV